MRTRRPARRATRLSIEHLEDRTNPAGFADPFAANLAIVDSPADRINVVTAHGTPPTALAAPFASGIEHVGFGIYNVTLNTGIAAGEAITYYSGLAGVAAAEPDYTIRVQRTPNDPQYSSLYAMAKIGAPAAWDTTTGSGNFVVAVIDSGVDYNHPDLNANMWRNPAEVNGDGIDNDGNGIVDDFFGANFAGANSGNPFDDNGHGTHVAGIIAAPANGLGIQGVAPDAEIVAVKVLSGITGSGTFGQVISGIAYAAGPLVHADIINMSIAPECAALPVTSQRMKIPPLRPVTTLPVGRPGSELNTQRASRATRSITARQEGEPISSSEVIRPASGPGAPPNRLKASSTNAFITSPAFMSATPGP